MNGRGTAARLSMLFMLALLLALPLGACGKRGPLDPPADEETTYPRTYPTR